MVSVTPDWTAAAERAVHRARQADRETPEPPTERRRIVGLDDEVDMVVLHTELKDPKALVGGRGERAADGREDTRGAQAADGLAAAESDMDGVRGKMRRPDAMRDARAAAQRALTARAGATASPGARRRERGCKVRAILIRRY